MSILHGVKGKWLAPPSTSTVFQMPFSAGYPLFGLAVLLATTVSPKANTKASAIALALVLSAASFSNIAVFLTVTGALLAYLGFLLLKELIWPTCEGGRWRVLLPILGVLGAVGVSCVISGFSDIIFKTGGEVILKAPDGMTGELYSNMQWNWGSFGLLIPAAVLGVFYTSKLRTFLVVHALGCLYAVNFYRYAHTWDIIKFGFVAEVSLAILSASLVCKLLRGGLLRKTIALVVIAGISAPAISYHLPLWEGRSHPFSSTFSLMRGTWLQQLGVTLSSDEVKSITWLRSRVGERDVVLRNMPTADLYVFLGGLPILQPDALTIAFNNSESRIQERYEIVKTMPTDVTVYQKEGATWVVVDTDPGAHDPLLPLALLWSQRGEAVERVSFNKLTVFELIK